MADLFAGIRGALEDTQKKAKRVARRKPVKRKPVPVRRVPVAPQRDLVRDAAASTFGVATGAARAAGRRESPAQARRTVKAE